MLQEVHNTKRDGGVKLHSLGHLPFLAPFDNQLDLNTKPTQGGTFRGGDKNLSILLAETMRSAKLHWQRGITLLTTEKSVGASESADGRMAGDGGVETD